MRTCKKCLQIKNLLEFKKHSNGYRHTCKKCQYEAMVLNSEAYKNKLARTAKYRNSDKGKLKEKVYAQSDSGKKARKLAIKKYEKGSGHAGKMARTAQRRAAKLQRTPSWLTDIDHERIRNEYKLAALLTKIEGIKWTVDHVIPLQGKFVSGLHVPSNLQVMRASENFSKRNKFEMVS